MQKVPYKLLQIAAEVALTIHNQSNDPHEKAVMAQASLVLADYEAREFPVITIPARVVDELLEASRQPTEPLQGRSDTEPI